ncbi:hypothetical protein [Verrucomicrobium sp. BvORR034]|uniref:hypothetical protein n=1 Tax=Verrucomicrobium sp. BvORR034 TaxID=1396418 RepID=UPI000679692A|nr:hypothetical protein [Verrucomicrobium sp. BvORR034]
MKNSFREFLSKCTRGIVGGLGRSREIGLLSVALFLIVFGVRLVWIHDMASPAPFWDQWDAEGQILYPPWVEGHFDWRTLFDRHNEHRILFPRLIFLALLDAHGIWDPILQMVVSAGLHGLFAVLLFVLLCHLTRGAARLCLVVALGLAAVPMDYENLLCGFQNSFPLMGLFGLAAIWVAAGAARPLGVRWWLGWLPLVLGVGTMAGGFFPALALAGMLIVEALAAPQMRTKAQVWGVGLLMLFAFGALAFHLPESTEANIHHSWWDRLRGLFVFLSWPVGAGGWGWLLVQLPTLAGLVAIFMGRLVLDSRVRIAMALSFWVAVHALAIAYARSEAVIASRYFPINVCGLAANFAWAVLLLRWAVAGGAIVRRQAIVRGALIAWSVVVLGAVLSDFLVVQAPAARSLAWLKNQHTVSIRRYLSVGDDRGLYQSKENPLPPLSNGGRLKKILGSKTLLDLLPADLKEAPPSTVVAGDERAFVRNGGVDARTGPAPHQPYWGSFLPPAGSAATGELTLEFAGTPATQWVEIWMAGAPSPKGSSLEIQDATGRRKIRLLPEERPGDQWKRFLVRIPYRPYRIKIADRFADRWFAFTEPKAVGHLEREKKWLLDNGMNLVLVGGALLLLCLFVEGVLSLGVRSETAGLSGGRRE